jgi:hypothetical protein
LQLLSIGRKLVPQKAQMGFPNQTWQPFHLRPIRFLWTCTSRWNPADSGPNNWPQVLSLAWLKLKQPSRSILSVLSLCTV